MSWTPYQLQLLQKQTASSSASISFTSLITSAYSTYFVRIRGLAPATTNTTLQMVWSTNNGSSYLSANYLWVQRWTNSAGTFGINENASDTSLRIQDTIVNTSGVSVCCDITLFNMNQASLFPKYWAECQSFDTTPHAVQGLVGGGIQSSTEVNAIQFAMSSGNITSGTFSLYGVTEP